MKGEGSPDSLESGKGPSGEAGARLRIPSVPIGYLMFYRRGRSARSMGNFYGRISS